MKAYTNIKHFLKSNIEVQQAALVNLNKAAFLNHKQAFLNQLQLGDSLQGKLIQDDMGKLLLQLKEGISLQVQLKQHMPLHQEISFVVEEMNEQSITLRPKEEIPLSVKVAETLNLPKDDFMKACIQQFIQDELPMDKELLLKSYQLHKGMKLPYPVVTQLIESYLPEAKNLLSELKNNPVQPVEQYIAHYEKHIIGQELPESEVKLNNLYKLMSHLTERIPAMLREEIIRREAFKQLPELFKQAFSETEVIKQDYIKEQFQAFPKECFELTKELYKELFKFDKQMVEKIVKEGTGIKETRLFEGYNELVKCIKLTEEMTLPQSVREEMKSFYEPMVQQAKIMTEGQYFIYPFQINQEKREAELYFYQPRKRNKKSEKDYLAVLKLDLASLQTVEIHMHQINHHVRIDFYVETEAIYKLIHKHLNQLTHKLKELPYEHMQCQCYLKDESIHKKEDTTMTVGVDLKI